ncbi:PepSY-associated TM helix domain-containing protein [Parasphingopyxis marina]|uniref:PepSY domain-containing protein n=1 Tax=Parasphingopyxis marina TaxID=2761622 RepID=A0A842I0W9_9SPHN|nr:PepSY-associated TM helix domain-containing protein [Parasphingopyxis marina]MBC2778333.1 PepSY domain-containing protein [Parasphingopyxis marina]
MWFRIHSFIGLGLSLVFAFVFLTGTLAVFSSEIDWLLTPESRVAPSSVSGETNWAAVARSAADYEPDLAFDLIEAPVSPIFAAEVYMTRPDGGLRVLYVHPETGAVQGEGAMLSAKALLRQAHRNWLLPDRIGIPLVTLTSLFLLGSLISAMIVYKRWWRGFLAWPRRGRGSRAFWGDLHRFVGAWSLAFGFVFALTGAWYLVEQLAAPAPAFETPFVDDVKLTNREVARALPEALALARRDYPELSVRQIGWPGPAGSALGFYGQDGTLLVRPRANAIFVDIFGNKVAGRHSGSDASAHQRISEAADPVHMGNFAGYWSKTLWFLAGALLTLVAMSGAVIYAKRAAAGGRAASADAPRGRWGWLSLRKGIGLSLFMLAMLLIAAGLQLPGLIALMR